ncbi:HEAT repeat domain-containing protein [Flavilitoribacter nigricans]|nr:HEAT repeat domain-containing protein [Flavilitoribacter nigricans]
MKENNVHSDDLIKTTISAEIGENRYEYLITATVYGEVIEIENLFLQLPEQAQRMMLGDQYDRWKPRIENFPNICRFALPIATLDLHEDESLEPLLSLIRERKKALNLNDLPPDLGKVRDPWTRDLFELFHFSPAKYLEIIRKSCRSLSVLLREEEQRLADACRHLGYYKFPLAPAVVRSVLPFMTPNHVGRLAGEVLVKFPEPENRAILLELYGSEPYQNIRSEILKGLSVYQDQEVYDIALKAYREETKTNKPEQLVTNILMALKNFHTPEVTEIAWEVLCGPLRFAGNEAEKILRSRGISDGDILDRIKPNFYDEKKPEYMQNVLARFHNIKNPYLLPRAEEFIWILPRLLEKKQNLNIAYATPSLIAKRYNASVPDHLYQLLEHASPFVRQAGVIQIGVICHQYDHVNFQFSERLEEKFFELLKDDHRDVVKEVANSLGNIAGRVNKAAYIPKLLPLVENKDVLIQLGSMRAINRVLEHVPFDPAICPTFLEALKHTNSYVRTEAVKGLQYASDPEIEAAWKALKDDPDDNVRRIINKEPSRHEPYLKVLQDLSRRSKRKARLHNSLLFKSYYYLQALLRKT